MAISRFRAMAAACAGRDPRWAQACAAALGLHLALAQALGGAPVRVLRPPERMPPQPRLELLLTPPKSADTAGPNRAAAVPPLATMPSPMPPAVPASVRPPGPRPDPRPDPRGPVPDALPGQPGPDPGDPAPTADRAVRTAESDGELAGAWPSAEALRGLPRYRVRLPGPHTAPVRAWRGAEPAHGQWRFESDADGRYRLSLTLWLGSRPWVALDSEGRLDPGGLQPRRHEDHRRGRAAAVNFDPVAGQARFAGRPGAAPTAESVQDRLSWLLQLPGILAGEPALRCAGATVWLQVVGARGSSALWRFDNRGLDAGDAADPVDPPSPGRPPLLLLVRQPQQPYDQRAEVWLEPQPPFRLRRLRLTPVPAGPAWTVWLDPADEGPATVRGAGLEGMRDAPICDREASRGAPSPRATPS